MSSRFDSLPRSRTQCCSFLSPDMSDNIFTLIHGHCGHVFTGKAKGRLTTDANANAGKAIGIPYFRLRGYRRFTSMCLERERTV
eukprot:scaffold104943_cov54-Attheya_sp.AAC.2